MPRKSSLSLFNLIAPVYALYYGSQKRRYTRVLNAVRNDLDISRYSSIIDVGCGTGALCSVLNQRGLAVTGVDQAQKMLGIAVCKPENRNINFIKANILERLPFADKSFDIAITSYVAHGLTPQDRKLLYAEMARLARHYAVIYDYNQKRFPLTSLAERLEGGDNYFIFIRNVESELKNSFAKVRVVNVDVQAAWYICSPA